jgi:hypothetical protein
MAEPDLKAHAVLSTTCSISLSVLDWDPTLDPLNLGCNLEHSQKHVSGKLSYTAAWSLQPAKFFAFWTPAHLYLAWNVSPCLAKIVQVALPPAQDLQNGSPPHIVQIPSSNMDVPSSLLDAHRIFTSYVLVPMATKTA